MTNDIDRLVDAVAALGDPADFKDSSGYPGLGLCVIDSIWSMGVRYEGVENVLRSYRTLRSEAHRNADEDTSGDLVEAIESMGGPKRFAESVKNRQRTSTKNGILKADAVLREAEALVALGVVTSKDLAEADSAFFANVETNWASIPGQRSLISWKYFLMLAGIPGVKPDRMVRRFVAEGLGRSDESQVSVDEAVTLVTEAAAKIGVDATTLDHQIWLYQRANS